MYGQPLWQLSAQYAASTGNEKAAPRAPLFHDITLGAISAR
jgi:hypothetical protein